MTEETPRIVVTVAAPVDEVWNALRDKKKIRHWFGWEYEGLEAEIDLIWFTHFTEDAETHTLDVQGGDKFEIEPFEGGSRITLTRAAHSPDAEWEAYYDEITEGWVTFVHQLKFAVERHDGQPRRTLFYGGAGSTSPVQELGLNEAVAAAVGTAYQADLRGEPVGGTVFFRSEHQVGLTVDSWGDGLLVLSHAEPSDAKPAGAAMAVLTFYGADDATRDAVNARWESWWAERHPAPQPVDSA